MRMATLLGRSQQQEVTADELHERRLQVARQNPHWTELQADFVERGPYLVSAATDEVFTPFRASTFLNGTASIMNETVPLHFAVASDALVFFQRLPRKWSELVAKRARSGARA